MENQVDFKILPSDQFNVYSPATRSDKIITYFTLLSKLRGDILTVSSQDDPNNIVSAYYTNTGGTQTLHLIKADGSEVTASQPQQVISGTVNYVSKFTTSNDIGNSQIFDDGTNVGIGTTSMTHKLQLGTGGVFADYYQLDTTYSNGFVVGAISWDSDNGTADIGLSGSLKLKVGQDDMWYVKNQTGSPITKGTAVYASGTLGASGRILVSPMIANGTIPARFFLGIVAETIANGADGYVMNKGKIRQINTNAYNEGDVLWVSPTTAGALTATEPTAPNLKLAVAFVVHKNTNGVLAIRSTTGTRIADASDVEYTGAADNSFLVYNSSTGVWEDETIGIFKTIAVAGQSNVVADAYDDTLTLVAGTNVTITTNASTDTITINATDQYVGTVTSVDMSVPTGFAISGNPITTSGTLALAFASGYSLPTNALQTNWTDAYNDKINSASFDAATGVITLTQQDAGTVTVDIDGRFILLSEKGAANGVATLDSGGKIPTSQLPSSVFEYKGTWNAATNTPTLANGTGDAGDVYRCTVAGTVNFGAGPITFGIGDLVIYDGTEWQKSDSTDAVTSVNGYTGTVVLTTTDIAEGTNLYFTTARARQSVSAGAGITYNNSTGVITNDAPDQTVILTGAGTTVVTGAYPNFTITSNDQFVGTVTSVNLTAGTGIAVSGGPITTNGSITVTNNDRGSSQNIFKNIDVAGQSTIVADNNDDTLTVAAGTGITLTTNATTDTLTITNNAPDQTVVLTGAGTTVITGTYPSFTITSNDQYAGTVTSVDMSVPTGFAISGNPITTSGTLALAFASGYSLPTNASQTNWDTAYNDSITAFAYNTSTGVLTLTQQDAGTLTATVTLQPFTTDNLTQGSTNLYDKVVSLTGAGTTVVTGTYPSFTITSNDQYVGTVTSVATTAPITGGTITSTGTIGITQSGTASDGYLSSTDWNTFNAKISGSGTTNYVAKFTGSSAVGNSSIFDNGNVGIGTSSPASVSGYTALTIDGTNGSFTEYRQNGTALFRIGADISRPFLYGMTNAPMDFYTNTSLRMRITGDGNVGIGTTSPLEKLVVSDGGAAGFEWIPSSGRWYRYNRSTSAYGGIYSEASEFTWSPYGSEAMRINGSGNVGIGTTAPGAKLEVVGDTYLRTQVFTDTIRPYTGNQLQLLNGGSNTLFINGNIGIGTTSPNTPLSTSRGIVINSGASNDVQIRMQNNYTGSTGSDGGLLSISNLQMYLWNYENSTLIFGTNNAEQMRITAAGNVGIGTTAPEQKLHVEGTIQLGNTEHLAWAYDNGSYYNYITNFYNTSDGMTFRAGSWTGGNNVDFSFQTYYGGSWSTKLAIKGDGNVGIGTTAPAAKLDVAGDIRLGGTATYNSVSVYNNSASGGGGYLAYQNGVANAYFGAAGWYIGNSDTGAVIGTDSSSRPIRFYTNTERMRITGGGDVGIGTTNPSYKLDVNGTGRFGVVRSNYYDIPSGTGFNSFQMGADTSAGGWYVYNLTTGTYNFVISNSGNVLIGTTTDAGYKLDVNGTGRIQGNLYTTARQYVQVSGNTLVAYKIPYNGLSNVAGTTVSDSQASNGTAMVRYSTEGNNTFFYGPYTTLEPGNYVAKFRIKVASNASASYIGYIDVSGTNVNGQDISLRPNMFPTSGDYYYIDVPFTCNGSASNIEFRWIDWRTGITDTYLDHVLVTSQAQANNVYVQDGGSYTIYEAQLPRLKIQNGSGNVGIGTTSPQRLLHVNNPNTGAGADGSIKISNATVGSGTLDGVDLTINTSGEFYITNRENGPTIFETNGSERMRITSAGNVGIGTTNPSAGKLEVYSTGDVPYILMNTTATTNKRVRLQFTQGGNSGMEIGTDYSVNNGNNFYFYDRVNGATLGFFSANTTWFNGNVGIGTTAPAYKLDISASGDVYERITSSSGNDAGIRFVSTGVREYGILNDGALRFYDFSAGTERMRITSGGNVGIGTTAPVSANLNSSLTIYKSYNGDTASVPSVTAQNYYENQSGLYLFGRNSSLTIVGANNENNEIVFANASSKNYAKIGTFNGTTSVGGDMYFTTGGNVEAMRITTGTNVGIGTTSPQSRLDLGVAPAQSTTSTLGYSANASLNIRIPNVVGDVGQIVFTNDAAPTAGYASIGVVMTSGAGVGLGDIIMSTKSVGSDAVSTERMRITSAGNVGIGNSNPGSLLQVGNAGAAPTGLATLTLTGANTAPQIATKPGLYHRHAVGLGVFSDYAMSFQVNGSSALSDAMYITNTGNVGIGTTAPSLESSGIGLDILNSSYTQLRVRSSSSSAGIEFKPGSGDRWEVQANTSNQWFVYNRTDEAYRLLIDGLGNVGIGTTAPTEKLHIVGGTAIQIIESTTGGQNSTLKFTTTARTWGIGANMALSNSNFEIYDYSASANRLTIDTSGNVGIGTTAPVTPLQVVSATNAVDVLRIGNTAGNSGSVQAITHLAINHFNAGTNPSTRITAYQDGLSGWPGGMYFSTRSVNTDSAPVERMRITSGGLVGIGTTAPSHILHIIDVMRMDNVSAYSPNLSSTSSPKFGYGDVSNDRYLAEPVIWFKINVDGTEYVIPGYTEVI